MCLYFIKCMLLSVRFPRGFNETTSRNSCATNGGCSIHQAKTGRRLVARYSLLTWHADTRVRDTSKIPKHVYPTKLTANPPPPQAGKQPKAYFSTPFTKSLSLFHLPHLLPKCIGTHRIRINGGRDTMQFNIPDLPHTFCIDRGDESGVESVVFAKAEKALQCAGIVIVSE